MRYLGLDFGSVRIGVAVSDPLGLTAQPLPYILNHLKKTIPELKKRVQEYDVDTIVLGLPKNQMGGDGPKALEVKAFGAQLEEALGCAITYWDERFSTKAVTRFLIEANVSRQKRREVVDSQSAVFVLQGFLDAKRN